MTECFKPKPADFRMYLFLNVQIEPASLVASDFNVDVSLLLGLSAKESGWGKSQMYRNQNNPFGFTPRGDATSGITFKSFYLAWQSWGKQFGPRVMGSGSNVDAFVGSLLLDNRNSPGAVDRRGKYNTDDPAWGPDLKATIPSVQKRLQNALAMVSGACP